MRRPPKDQHEDGFGRNIKGLSHMGEKKKHGKSGVNMERKKEIRRRGREERRET